MNLSQLKSLISQGESEQLEFKNTTGQRTVAMKTVCAMLNGLGGIVLFGVSDSGELKGQDLNTGTMESLNAEINRIDPPAFPESAVFLTLKPYAKIPSEGGALQPESGGEPGAELGVEPGVASEMALQILNHLKSNALSKKEIALKLGKSKPTRYLNDLMRNLLKKGVVAYTIPDTPNSPLQKYRLTEKGSAIFTANQKSGRK